MVASSSIWGPTEATEATWARVEDRLRVSCSGHPGPRVGTASVGSSREQGASSSSPPSWEGCPPAMVEGMGERGQAVRCGGALSRWQVCFSSLCGGPHPELGGPESPWKAVGGGGPLAPSYVPHPPTTPPPCMSTLYPQTRLLPRGWSPLNSDDRTMAGTLPGVPRVVCSWVGYRSSSGGVCEGWHLGWGLGGSQGSPRLKERVFKRLWGH